MRVVIAAAGTGGHINPGIAIANKIEQEEKKSNIMFIGTDRGIEKDLVPRAGYKLKTIEAYGFSTKLSITNLKNTIKTLQSVKKAKQILQEFKPDIVIGTGGYICGPVLTAAQKLRNTNSTTRKQFVSRFGSKNVSEKNRYCSSGVKRSKREFAKSKKCSHNRDSNKNKKTNIK